MKALSIRQPWAWLIVMGVPELVRVPVPASPESHTLKPSGRVAFKDIENRRWPLPKWFTLPQRIYVHAGTRRADYLEQLIDMGVPAFFALMAYSGYAARGCIVGEADIVDCVRESKSPWFEGPYGFVLANPQAYKEPIPFKGRLGFFEVGNLSLKHTPIPTESDDDTTNAC